MDTYEINTELSIESFVSIKMRVQTEEWRRFIPGVRMYKGKKTYFYNGEILWDRDIREWLIYNWEERQTWEVIIVLPGVEVIPYGTFSHCMNVKTVIMSDTVKRIEGYAFSNCNSLVFVKLSRNLEYIGECSFSRCKSLTSIFIPPSCREIGREAFNCCKKLIIFCVPQDTQLGANVLFGTALMAKYQQKNPDQEIGGANHWVQNLHADDEFSLHRVFSAFNPSEEVIFDIVKRQGLGAFNEQDSAGITASQYLSQNPFTYIKEQKIIKRYILDMMGEIV